MKLLAGEEAMMRLDNKVAIITGSARGIGRAVALGMAREGASVAIADLRDEQARQTAREIEAAGGQALAVAADVANLDDLDRLVAATLDRFGRIDILHNNAGISGGAGDFFGYTVDDWDRILNINLKSAFFLTQKVARVMLDQGHGGRILNTASIAAFVAASRPTIPYDISKAGLRQMTVSLAALLGPHSIAVNAIAPGTIETELSAGLMSDERWTAFRQRRREQTPLGRLGQPDDLVGAAIFLCSDEAAYVTGHTLVVDGGLLTV
jgi:NAD(P)-dependent dehydrogenase (short-subunit alcohol dehydrogenase family)